MKSRAMLAGVAALLATSGAAQAFVLNGNRWPGSHPRIPYYVSTNLQGNVPYDGSATFDAVVQHIQNAANVWNTQGATESRFTYAGTTAVNQVVDDGINAVIFSSDKCPYGGGCYAYTAYHQTNGVYHGFDVVLYKYSSSGARIQWRTQLTYPTQMDIWTVVQHELGHALGLAHSQYSGVVMGFCASPGSVRRSLFPDDVAGIQAIYPLYTNEGFWSDASIVAPAQSFLLHLDYPRATSRNFALLLNSDSSGVTPMPSPDSRILPLASPYENARDYPTIFLNPTCLQGGQCQGMFGTLDNYGHATVTVQLPSDALTSLGPDLHLAAVTRNTSMPSGYEDISVELNIQILAPPPCSADAECDDGDPCTQDVCDSGECVSTAYDCDDGDACTVDACQDGSCVSAPLACDDGNACTADACDPVLGCVGVPIFCDDGNACTTDSCNPATGCVHTALTCNDNNACTTDSCEPNLGCVYSPIAGCSVCKAKYAACKTHAECCSGKCKPNGNCE